MKVCSKCNLEKELIDFNKSKLNKDNLRGYCKICQSKLDKLYREKNKEKLKEYSKKHYKINKVKIYEQKKEYRKANVEYFKKYQKEYSKNRKNIDHLYRFRSNTRSLISNSFKRGVNQFSKNAKTETILGCTIQEFVIYISSKFLKGMNLNNYGEWHLDHIKPISLAESQEEIIILNHYTNFQPLWAEDNIKKSNKF